MNRGTLRRRSAFPTRGWRRLLVAVALTVAAAPALHAAGGPAVTETWLGVPRWVWLTGNLIIFWGGLFYFAGPPIRRFLDQRAEHISRELAEARRQRVEAEGMSAVVDSKLAELRAEMDELVSHSEHAAQRDREEILERTERDRERLLEQTRDEIEQRVAVARQELRRDAARLASQLAAERLDSAISSEDRRRLFDENLERFERESIP